MKILFTGVNSGIDKEPGPLKWLSSIAKREGHETCSALEEAPDLLICVDYQSKFKSLLQDAAARGVPRILIKQEPPVVYPLHGIDNPHGLFSMVITRGYSSNVPIFNSYQDWDVSYLRCPDRLNRVVAITADKWSSIPGELYSLRRLAYSKDERVDLFGYGWGDSNWVRMIRIAKEILISISSGVVPSVTNLNLALARPLNYLGSVENKLALLSRYKVSLVIENEGTRVSEKLVDCILAGTIPVYVGTPFAPFGVPDHLVIHSEPNLSSIQRSLTLALSWSSKDFISRAELWASDPESRENWDAEKVGSNILLHITDKFPK